MRYKFSILLIAILAITACKKSVNACKNYKEVTECENLVDAASIPSGELRDTLAKYPQLSAYKMQNDQYSNSINCHVYYKSLLIFNEDYFLNKSYYSNTISSGGGFLKYDPNVSLDPAYNYTEAIEAAKRTVNFDNSCISYQLGLYNLSGNSTNVTAIYRLAWKISDSQKPYIYVLVDAENKWILMADNGVRWVN